MRALKALVITLGIAIIVAATVLATLIVQRTGSLGRAPASGTISIPAGARIVESRLDEGRILLRLTLPSGDERLVILDAATGESLATHSLIIGGGGS